MNALFKLLVILSPFLLIVLFLGFYMGLPLYIDHKKYQKESICEILGLVLACSRAGKNAFEIITSFLIEYYDNETADLMLLKVRNVAQNKNYENFFQASCGYLINLDLKEKEHLMDTLCKISDAGNNNTQTMAMIMKIGQKIKITNAKD